MVERHFTNNWDKRMYSFDVLSGSNQVYAWSGNIGMERIQTTRKSTGKVHKVDSKLRQENTGDWVHPALGNEWAENL